MDAMVLQVRRSLAFLAKQYSGIRWAVHGPQCPRPPTGWGKRALSCNKTSVPQAECRAAPVRAPLSLQKGLFDVLGIVATLQPLGLCCSQSSMCCAASSRVCSRLLLFRGIYLCGHSAGAHLAAMVLCTDWTEFGVVPDIRGSASTDLCSPCSGRLVLSTGGLHRAISCFPDPAAWL